MYTKFLISAAVVFVLVLSSVSQTLSGKWNIYTSYREVKAIGLGQNKVWAATSGGVYNFDHPSLTNTNKYSSLDGLLSNDLTAISVSNDGKVWAGGFDGSISVLNIEDNSWRQITDIKTSTEPTKKINAFYQYNNFMFFATEFCIVKFSIPQFQFVDQPYIFLGNLIPVKTPVYDIIVINDTIWAGTKNGIAYANINSSLPIQSSWKNFITTNSALKSNVINAVTYFDSKVVFGTDSGLVSFQNGSLDVYSPLYNGQPIPGGVYRVTVANGNLYYSTFEYQGGVKTNFRVFKVNQSNINSAELVAAGFEVNSLKVASNGDLLIGTVKEGVNVYRNNTINYVVPNGPASNVFQDITIDNSGSLWAVSGGVNAGIYRYDMTNWKNYSTSQYPWIESNDLRHIYASKYSNTIWGGGYGSGLLKIEGDSLTLYDNQNSCLQAFEGNFTLVEGIGEDNSGNLWIINRASIVPIVNFKPGGCQTFPVPTNPASTTMIYMSVDNYNTKWMTFPSDLAQDRGVVYFNENSNPTGRIIPATSLGANIRTVYHIVTDKNGEVWIGTDNGIAIVREPAQVINNPGSIPSLEKMRIIENGISTPLTENVQFIAVDALNNKWIGTLSNGLLYVSPDGSTLLARYNTANSPLPDNKILSIVVSDLDGSAYFGTEKGLVSLKTIAVKPLEECDKISAGPNPYLVPGDVKLKIDGLVSESTVKILTISGVLVAEIESPGGRIAEWDGKDMNGNYVSSGIYIIAGFNKDASKVCTGKVAVVRR